MAVYTSLSPEDASRITNAHGLGPCLEVVPVSAGSVNSNFFLVSAGGRHFLRIYEEQGKDGVEYEWDLLDFLGAAGVPVPKRVPGTTPGQICVAGKPTALFEVVPGGDICHRLFDVTRARQVGLTLARIHRIGAGFQTHRASRFKRDTLPERLDTAAAHGRPELIPVIAALRALCAEVDRAYPADLPRGVIHGDMFRDNVFWEGQRVSAVIDWESASDGELIYDLAVVFLAWCYADDFRWDVARALFAGYQEERALTDAERGALRTVCLAGATRFAITRILDFHLRGDGVGDRVMKDYRRFVARADTLAALDNAQLVERLLGPTR
ncbi:MAG: homoserine kinase [Sandaracinaceae bacterium]|nr:homoserine kinase [Sandaracinaceae bacterium]